MPSKPPPLSLPQDAMAAWWIQTTPTLSKTPSINKLVILAATLAALVAVSGVVVWIAAHPSRTSPPTAPALAVVTPTRAVASMPPPSRPALTRAILPAVHRPERSDVVVCAIPHIEETPPPLPPPIPRSACAAPPVGESPLGETYGTHVLFLNNPEVAEETAQREKKLLFVMHISGNFENSCFT